MRSILILIAIIFSFANAATKTCQPTIGITGSLCGNETHNAYVIPAKVCAYGPVDVSSTACVAQVFSTWQLTCPKRNKDLNSFCQGWGGFENIDYNLPCWVLQSCTSDADCAAVAPPFGPTQKKKCYSCCELCYDDCDSRVGDWYAAKGVTDCTACPYTATPHAFSPISAPVKAPVAAPVATPVKAPVATPVSAPVKAPVPAPVSTPVSTPVKAPVVAPVSAPVKAPIAAPVSAPVKAPVAAPVAAPVSAPVKAPVAAPVATPVKAPVAMPVSTPVKAPVASETPVSTTPVSAPVASASPVTSTSPVAPKSPVTGISPASTPASSTTQSQSLNSVSSGWTLRPIALSALALIAAF